MKTRQYLWRLILYRPSLYTLNSVLQIANYLLPLPWGFVAREFFDTLAGHGRTGLSVWTIVLLDYASLYLYIALGWGGGLAGNLHRYIVSALLRRNLFESILRQPGARALSEPVGAAISRFRDDAMQVENSVSWTIDVTGQALFALVAIVVLLAVNAQVALFVFVPLTVVIVAVQFVSTRIEFYRRASRESTARVTGALGEMFNAVQAIQVAGAEEHVIAHFGRLNDQRRQWMLKDTLLTGVLQSVFGSAFGFGTGLILLVAAQAMQTGSFTVGDFALFASYLGPVTGFLQFFGMFLARYKQTGVAFERMTRLMPGTSDSMLVKSSPLYISAPPPALRHVRKTAADRLDWLSAADLAYHYPEGGQGIERVNLRLTAGSFTVITGRIGSGKTTLLRTLLGLLPKETGQIEWNGELVDDSASFFVPPHCAYTPQVPRLFSDTLKNNILLGLPEDGDEDARRLLAAVRAAVLEPDVAAMEKGLDTVIGPRGVRLSGGQAHRAAAARMFVRDAELLVFDDLSSALDVETEQLLWERLFARKENGEHAPTCLVVSHRRTALRRAEHIIVLKDGYIEAEGNLDELLMTCTEMQRLWEGDLGQKVGSGQIATSSDKP